MWDVIRFAEHHRYRSIIVENVVDAAHWVPWDAWRAALTSLGYLHRVVYLNSMHAQAAGLPAPQSRDRLYVIAWRTGQTPPDLDRWTRPRAWCPVCGPVRAIQSFKNTTSRPWGRYRAQYVYRCPNTGCRNRVVEPAWLPASTAIDWTNKGQRIGDRPKPLAAKTMARIEAGLKRFAPESFLTVHRHDYRTAPMDFPAPAMTAPENHGQLSPVKDRAGEQIQPCGEPLRTVATRNGTGVVVMLRGTNTAKTTTQPFDTFAAAGFHHALLMRNNTTKGDGAEMCTPTTEVMRTLTTTGHQSLLQWGQLVVDFNGPARPVTGVLPTQTTVEGDAVASVETDPMDCLFRMLEPREIAAGMAFPTDYVILGNRRAQVRQAGNAVTPPAARDLITAVAETL